MIIVTGPMLSKPLPVSSGYCCPYNPPLCAVKPEDYGLFRGPSLIVSTHGTLQQIDALAWIGRALCCTHFLEIKGILQCRRGTDPHINLCMVEVSKDFADQ